MVSRRAFIAGILGGGAALAVGLVAYRLRNRFQHVVFPTSGQKPILGAMHFPTTLESPAFSEQQIDNLFTDMLAAAGVQMVVFEWDYQVFSDSRWNSRLLSAYAYAKSKGLKTQIINQMQPIFWGPGNINPPSASVMSGSAGAIDSYEAEIVAAYSQLKPDYLTVLAEPNNLETKFKFSYTSSQWQSLVQDLVDGAAGSGSSLWVDLVPNSGIDMGLVPSLCGVSGLNGLGMDVYGQANETQVEDHLAPIAQAGKSWGVSETWWGPLFVNPSINTVQNEPAMGSWFAGSYDWAMGNGATMYNPFYTNLFVQKPGKTSFTNADLTAYFSQELSLLQAGSYTSIHDAYAALAKSPG